MFKLTGSSWILEMTVGFAQLLKSECEKMPDHDDDVPLASAAIIISSVLKVHEFWKRWFWVGPSLQAEKKCSITDLIKDRVLDDVDLSTLHSSTRLPL